MKKYNSMIIDDLDDKIHLCKSFDNKSVKGKKY